MPTIEALTTYFTSFFPLSVMGTVILSEIVSALIFLKSQSSKKRSNALTVMFGSSVFLWLFIAISILMCYFLSHGIEYNMTVVKTVAGASFSIGLIIAAPSSIILKNRAPKRLLQNIKGNQPIFGDMAQKFQTVKRLMGIKKAELLQLDSKSPTCIAVGGERNVILISTSLLRLLNTDELDAIFAHELAHIVHGDLMIKALMGIYRMIIPFDLLIRFVEGAMHRERELMADEAAVNITEKPMSLASALIKIHEASPVSNSSQPGLFATGNGFFKKNPSLEKRVKQLLTMTS
jgi:Zn-dependent protease with chaperone function